MEDCAPLTQEETDAGEGNQGINHENEEGVQRTQEAEGDDRCHQKAERQADGDAEDTEDGDGAYRRLMGGMEPAKGGWKHAITGGCIDDTRTTVNNTQRGAKKGADTDEVDQESQDRAAEVTADGIKGGASVGIAGQHMIGAVADRADIGHQYVEDADDDHRAEDSAWNIVMWIPRLFT